MQSTSAQPFATSVAHLRIKLFADGADLATIDRLAADPQIAGFTTNPTLMRKAGVDDYTTFSRRALEIVGNRPISFEVFADEPSEMLRQARVLTPSLNHRRRRPHFDSSNACVRPCPTPAGASQERSRSASTTAAAETRQLCPKTEPA